MSEQRRGFLFGVAAYLLWGLFPLYWPLLRPSGAVEILAHRIVWSLAVVGVLLGVAHNWHWVRTLGRRRLLLLTIGAIVVAINWATYIYGVNSGHVVETSLGYFINPLVTVMIGVLVLRERLRRAQWTAVTLATAAVVVLTVDYGRPPWIALILAFSFATYGLTKKKAGVGAVESLAVETAILALPALGYLALLHASGDGAFGGHGWLHAVLLVGSGLVTAIPLLCFGGAAIRVPLTTIGLLQYLAPIMQFLLGVLYFREEMPASRAAGFALVWIALVILSVDGVRNHRRSLQRAAEAVAA